MNTQEIITPIGKALEWSFNSVLLPIADPLNFGIVVLSLVGMVYWLSLQKKYTKKAEEDGTIV